MVSVRAASNAARRSRPAEETVVGAEKLLPSDPGPDEAAEGAHAWIDHDDMERAGRKCEAGLADQPGGRPDVVRRQVVGDVDEVNRLPCVQQPSLDLRDVARPAAEVGGERDDAEHPTDGIPPASKTHDSIGRHLTSDFSKSLPGMACQPPA